MADNYKEYLAARVLNDSRPVTYRLLSRAQKVNVNTAKQMLFEFHSKQNAKKLNSVHATYLLTGRKRDPENNTNGTNGRDGEDTFMASSPPYMSSIPSSMPEAEEPSEMFVPRTSIMLVREEELEKTKAAFEEVTSIHIYSLQPGPIENLNILSVCNHEVATEYASEDPLEQWRTYGSMHNPYIKRRVANSVSAPVPAATKAAPKPVSKPSAASHTKEKEATAPRRGSASEDNTSGRSTPQPTTVATRNSKTSDPKATLKRNTSDIFKSFAKAKPKAKEAEISKESTIALPEDDLMQGMSEDEGDNDDTPEVVIDDEKVAAARKAREERKAILQKMMDEDDDDMPDAPPVEENESQDAPLDKPAPDKPDEIEATVTVQGGRRRGRRRVMIKKKVKNEDGYLVTKEEAGWESFSEAEPDPKKLKPAPTKSVNTAKGKKTGKPGQGSIASFFKKA